MLRPAQLRAVPGVLDRQIPGAAPRSTHLHRLTSCSKQWGTASAAEGRARCAHRAGSNELVGKQTGELLHQAVLPREIDTESRVLSRNVLHHPRECTIGRQTPLSNDQIRAPFTCLAPGGLVIGCRKCQSHCGLRHAQDASTAARQRQLHSLHRPFKQDRAAAGVCNSACVQASAGHSHSSQAAGGGPVEAVAQFPHALRGQTGLPCVTF